MKRPEWKGKSPKHQLIILLGEARNQYPGPVVDNLLSQCIELAGMVHGDWPDLKRFAKLLDKNGINAFVHDATVFVENDWIIKLVNNEYEISHNLKRKRIVHRFSSTKQAFAYIDENW